MSPGKSVELPTITCSAPGKVLLLGGYLVLDPSYTGLVLSLDAKIYSTILPRATKNHSITVYSPQFEHARWNYSLVKGVVNGDERNPFVKEALQTCLTYFGTRELDCDICILADNQYYSMPESQGQFSFSDKSISETPKTGLGSSAALVTSLCAAIYIYLSRSATSTSASSPASLSSSELSDLDRRKIHNLAQIAHSKAQGKVGSGFDIASAVYGSCLYSRFPASTIDALSITSASNDDDAATAAAAAAADNLISIVNRPWDMKVQQVKLRPGLALLMGDIQKGSSTPGMVQKVLSCPSALALWPSLGISNELLAEHLVGGEYSPSPAPAPAPTSTAGKEQDVRQVVQTVRELLKQMGVEAKVEIEPDSQTVILDETARLPSVLACGVPGAGGFDAIYAIVHESEEARAAVKSLWHRHEVKMLNLRQVEQGVCIESSFDLKQHLDRGLSFDEHSTESSNWTDLLEAPRKIRPL